MGKGLREGTESMGVQWPYRDLKLTCSVNMCLARVLLIVITTTAMMIIMTTTTVILM